MFVYLSKKIAIPNNTKLKCVSWNKSQGYLACGGDNALLKVLQLDSGRVVNNGNKGVGAPSNLSMNQTLEGHSSNGAVQIVRWNEGVNQKLTSADQFGLITVWMLYKGSWNEDMINNRNKSVVTDMKWSSDGQKICIVYEDGAVIVGSVEGNRIWNRDLKGMSLSHVEWSPSGHLLLFGLSTGEIHVFDSSGNAVGELNTSSSRRDDANEIAGIHWYNGKGGYVEPNCPCLAICYASGRVQIMRNENDEEPVIFNCGETRVVNIEWNFDGSILAIAGISQMFDGSSSKVCNVVQFYSPFGEHLQTLKLPGKEIVGCSWEGSGLRIALAIDSFIYFANIRPTYKWCYFANTVVYTYTKADRTDRCVVFWNTKTNEQCVKYVKSLLAIAANQEYCVLATKSEDDNEQFALVVCNSIGTPVDSKYVNLCPLNLSMSSSFIVAASHDKVIVWRFHTPQVKSTFNLGRVDIDSSDEVHHIDKISWNNTKDAVNYHEQTNSPVVCICNSDNIAVLARKCGLIQQFSLPNMTLITNVSADCQPFSIALNSSSTRLSVISHLGSVLFVELSEDGDLIEPQKTVIQHLDRKDVWDLKWSMENSEMFVVMEKARLYVFRKLDPEEPTVCNGYICHFEDLQIKTVMLDELLMNPENTDPEIVVTMEVKSLRDTRDLLEKVGIKDAMQFIEDNPHPKLWKLLGEAALEKIDLQVAETAFVHCRDYPSLDFIKRLQNIQNENLKKAEIASYFHRFDEAEKIFLDNDRRDLAISLRRKLGDWFRVVQLLKSDSNHTSYDTVHTEAWNAIGDYYADRQRWEEAVKYYEQSRNHKQLLEGYFILEDYNKLENLAHGLPEGDDLFMEIAEMFATVGMCEQAVYAYTKCGNIKSAIDCCITLNNWGKAVELAERYHISDISPLLAKYALYLLDKKKSLSAVELYRKAGKHLDASQLLIKIAKEENEKKAPVLTLKRLYVLAGLALEEHRSQQVVGSSKHKSSNVIANLLEEASFAATSNDRKVNLLEDAWIGAEAFHFYILAQKQLYEGHYDAAMKTAINLQNYENVLNKEELYLLLALSSCANRAFGVCSKAFTKLESLENLPIDRKDVYEKLALDIFTSFPPKDNRAGYVDCPLCNTKIIEWNNSCPNCGTHFKICMATGSPLFDSTNQWTCHRCKRCAHVQYMVSRKTCPLCHSSV